MRTIFTALLFMLVFAVSGFSAQAQDDAKAKENPVISAYQDFTKDLNQVEARHFGIMYSNYNLIKVVEAVKKSIEKAVFACGQNNPNIKEKIEQRYEEWGAEINPILDEARGHIGNMTIAQDYAEPEKIRSLFALIDKTRAEQEAQHNKVPSTTPRSCQFLLYQMNDSQANMAKLLRSTLISLPMTIQEESTTE